MSVQPLISAVESASSALELLRATAALARCADAAAAPTLVEVLGFNNPGAAVAAVDGLIAIGSPAVDHLLELDQRNYGARAWAVRALAGIGDVRGLDLLIEALLTDVGPSVRRAAAKGLGNLQLAALTVGERATVAQRCLDALIEAVSDGEWVVRYAVAVGLEGLARGCGWSQGHPGHGHICTALAQLGDPSGEEATVVRLRAALALQRLQPS
ncbi:MAG: HEAT repeat domain-containing protein [Cyanobacteria bacterium REEB417]|nr:HEAT repeat domain-containing protein [Cyanobacteria bacterium REEB417]